MGRYERFVNRQLEELDYLKAKREQGRKRAQFRREILSKVKGKKPSEKLIDHAVDLVFPPI